MKTTFFRNFGIILILLGLCISNSTAQLKIAFSSIEVAGKEVEVSNTIFTGYNRNNFRFQIAAIEGKLDSLSLFKRISKDRFGNAEVSEWEKIEGRSFKIINIETGKFTVEVKAVNSGGIESNIVSTQININRPWWRTWWFWGASFLGLFGLFYSRERLLKQWEDEEKVHHQQIIELELKTLQLQMNPHFIFNALNSIQSYVLSHDALTANNYLSKFANLIRLFLDSSRSKYISLSEEIRLLSLYCEMEMLRFENKFSFEIKVDPEVDRYFELPTMILQPFVENSINHGLRYKKEKGRLIISFQNEGNHLIAKIEDNGVGRKVSKLIQDKPKKGYKSQGLNITSERLITYNKINDSNIIFTIEDQYTPEENEEQGTIVTVKFPLN